MMKVYTNRLDHFFYYNVKMTADYVGVPLQTVVVDEAMAGSAEFKAKKAHGQFPLLELADGTLIRESTAIASFIARQAGRSDFVGATAFEEASVSQFLDFGNSTLTPLFRTIAFHTFGIAVDEAAYKKAVQDMKNQVKVINEKLKGKSWLVGDSLTLADIATFNILILPFAFVLDGGFRKAMPDITAWFDKMSKLPVVARTAGYVKMQGAGQAPAAGKGGDAGAAKGGKKGGKGGDAGQGKGGKKDGGKKEAAKKEEPKADASAAAATDDVEFDPFAEGGDDEDAAAQLKAKAALIAKKAAKKPPVAKSLVVWDVKGWDDTTDLTALGNKILAEIAMDGLSWKTEFKLEPVAFGVKKLQIGAVIEDEKVSADGIAEEIEKFEDYVQSVDIAVFNKL
jgi:glutathione S-transferase/translation elongation factor EF-1beta